MEPVINNKRYDTKKKVLLIGKHSYIGTSFVNYITSNYPEKKWEIESISVRDGEWKKLSFKKYDSILYLAGVVHQKRSKKTEADTKKYYKVNCNLAVKIARKAMQEGVKQFIYMSSMSVYGINQGVITKNTIPAPMSDYGKSKFLAEKELKQICRIEDDNLLNKSMKLVIVRPPMIYGKECKGNYVQLSKLARITPVFPKIDNQRSQLYIDNLNEFLMNIIEREEKGTFFPQNKEYVCTSNMVKEIAKVKGKDIFLISGFEKIVTALSQRYIFWAKVFGNLVYEKKMSETSWEYQVKDWKISIRETEEENNG